MQINKNSTLTEILDYITEPNDIEKRKEAFLEAYNNLPFFQIFIDICFFDGYKDFAKLSDFQYSSKVSKLNNYITSASDVLIKYIPKLKDDSGLKDVSRISLFKSLLEESHFEDIPLLIGMVKGRFVYKNEKINQVFLSKVFETKKLN